MLVDRILLNSLDSDDFGLDVCELLWILVIFDVCEVLFICVIWDKTHVIYVDSLRIRTGRLRLFAGFSDSGSDSFHV